MDRSKIDRINELAHLAKTRPLTDAETEERKLLREEYIQSYRANLAQQLDALVIEHPDGTRAKLQRKKGVN